MTIYDEFAIETFEAGKGLWHARIRRADHEPIMIGDVSFASLEVGFAWSDTAAAVADAINHIDRFGLCRSARRRHDASPQAGAAS